MNKHLHGQIRMKSPSITSPWWPLFALMLGCCLLCGLFWVGYNNNPSGFLDGLKAQDWATIASGIFAALAFAGLMVSIFYQRAEIDSLQKQVSETVQALDKPATSLRVQASEAALQTDAVLQQVACQGDMLAAQLFNDIDQYIEGIEHIIGEKLDELFRRLDMPNTGVPAFEELLKKDNPSSWRVAVVRQRAQREGQGPDAVTRFLERRRVRVIFNTISSRCDLVGASVNAMVQQAPHMKPHLDARLADSRVNRIQAVIRYAREDLERRPANAA